MLIRYVAPHRRFLFVSMKLLGKMDDGKCIDSLFDMPTTSDLREKDEPRVTFACFRGGCEVSVS